MKRWSVMTSALILIGCGSTSKNQEDPTRSAEKVCQTSPGKVWSNGTCEEVKVGLTEQQSCEQNTTKIWVEGACQNRPEQVKDELTEQEICEQDTAKMWVDSVCQNRPAPGAHPLKATDLVGAWGSKDCALAPVGRSWQTTSLTFGSGGDLIIQVLLYPTGSCEFYEERMEYGSTFKFDEALQKITIAHKTCRHVIVKSGQERDCSSTLTSPQSFAVTAASASHMTMNSISFDKLSIQGRIAE